MSRITFVLFQEKKKKTLSSTIGLVYSVLIDLVWSIHLSKRISNQASADGQFLTPAQRLYQQCCPIVFVHKAEQVEELVNREDKAVVETARVQEQPLLPTSHPKLTWALTAWKL